MLKNQHRAFRQIPQFHGGLNRWICGRSFVLLFREPTTLTTPTTSTSTTSTVTPSATLNSVTAILSHLIDDNIIVVEVIVPNTQQSRRVLCQIHFFARLGDEFAERTRDGIFDNVKGMEAGEEVDLVEHSPTLLGVGYNDFDDDNVVIDERGEDDGDGVQCSRWCDHG